MTTARQALAELVAELRSCMTWIDTSDPDHEDARRHFDAAISRADSVLSHPEPDRAMNTLRAAKKWLAEWPYHDGAYTLISRLVAALEATPRGGDENSAAAQDDLKDLLPHLRELIAAVKLLREVVSMYDASSNNPDWAESFNRSMRRARTYLSAATPVQQHQTQQGDVPKSIADGNCAPRPDSESPGSTSPPTLADGKRDFAGGRETGTTAVQQPTPPFATLWQHGEEGRLGVEFDGEPRSYSHMAGWQPIGRLALIDEDTAIQQPPKETK